MPSDRAPDSLVSAWTQQPTSGFRLVPSDFAKKVRADVRHSRSAFWIGLLLFALMIVWGGVKLFSATDPVVQAGYVLWILAAAFFAGQMFVLRRRVRAVRFDVDRTTAPSLTAARAYLMTRRAYHSGRWLWSRVVLLFPVVPVLNYGTIRNEPDATLWLLSGTMIAWVALLAFAVFIVQRGAARDYERLLRDLDDIEGHSPMDRFMAAHEQWKQHEADRG